MKTSRNTPQQLILDHVPWFWAVALVLFTLVFVAIGSSILIGGELFGLLFIFIGGGVGLICIAVFVERLQVVLNRDTNLLRIRRRTLLGYREETHALDRLERAVVQSSSGGQNNSKTYRPALVLVPERGGPAEAKPITHVYSSGRGADHAERAINDWLQAR
ncbi:hypothetical protein [Aliiruegeria lutimaris]|uniref:Uncharacterized protein n=1 Tax=Aliiruegeria lutimaris TaxID=571298 RepID=A0A1G8SHU0_9RHOB|nr:hypothetical protein [Aliiruegeria lutimaris]SDJ28812.1 hypothetical protein SAMN04488026_101516 [Aliiruegeria lutimaris]